MANVLQELGIKYHTDKSWHVYNGITYLDIYDRYFNKMRHDVKTMLEIGVRDGGSLRMWQEYFPNAIIYGVDINPDCKKHENDRIKIIIGDQNDDDNLNQIKNIIGSCDIILDDGSHMTKHQIRTFNVLYGSVKRGGYYVIEDLRNSYEEVNEMHDLRNVWSGMSYNKPDDLLKNVRKDFSDWIESKVKDLDYHKQNMNLLAIHHYPMIIIFENLK